MTVWDPNQYLKFERERLQPAIDLYNRIRNNSFSTIYDLGCGTGNVTQKLKETWNHAQVTGIDSSADMLVKAKQSELDIKWLQADLNDWIPEMEPDLLFSNATLHWLDNHEILFPKLMGYLKKGGILAVQMPNNFSEPTHRAIFETIRGKYWGKELESGYREQPVLDPSIYYELLEENAEQIDIWETTYLHVLEGANPVKEWTKGSILKPFLNNLGSELANEFEADYARKILKAYPPHGNRTFMPFRRLFIVAKKL